MSTEERLQILRMVESKQITAEQAAKLLTAIEPSPAESGSAGGELRSRLLRVRVVDRDGHSRFNLTIPYSLVEIASRFGVRFIPRDFVMGNADPNDILAAIRSGVRGKLVELEDEQNGQRIEIFVE